MLRTARGNRWRSIAIAGLMLTCPALIAGAQDAPKRGEEPMDEGGLAGGGVCGIFVATSGSDVVGGGLTSSTPVQTINFALQRAVIEGATCVFVRAGTYNEEVNLVGGVSIIGGFNANWEQAAYTVPGHASIIAAPASGAVPYSSVSATGLVGAAVTISNVIIMGPNVSPAAFGASSYGLYASNNSAAIVLSNLRIEGGNAANGLPGSAGGDAASLSATAGMTGVIGESGAVNASCNTTTRSAGGSGGGNSGCSAGVGAVFGGSGGSGGLSDTNCGFPPDNDPTVGLIGTSGGQASGGFGGPGPGGSVCLNGQPGQPGRITNGAAGAGASIVGTVVAGAWMPANGGNGSLGSNGGGGGGGGGAGGCDNTGNTRGGGGGGGGAGGCRAVGAGGGGGGAGGSFGVFASNSNITLNQVEIIRGNGGTGGNGGNGGQGQLGGGGGPGGPTPGGNPGGTGGAGGHGGHGGGGGGGAGGVAYGVYCSGSSIANLGTVVTGGSAGLGGAGGFSAPFAPGSIDDGNDGTAGINGALGGIIACSSTGPTPPATCSPASCITLCLPDINDDGQVNVTDLLAVIAAWGPCP